MTNNNNERRGSLMAKDSEVFRTTFRLKKDTLRKIKIYAIQHDTSVTVLMNRLVEDFLDKKEKEKEKEKEKTTKK